MIRIDVNRLVNAPAAEVWASWDAFGNIKASNPNITDSLLLPGSIASGLGAKRRCELDNRGNHIVEQIVGYAPGQQMVVAVVDGTAPVRDARLTLDIEAQSPTTTRVRLQIRFRPAVGLLGPFLAPLMRRKFTCAMTRLLASNATHVEAQLDQAGAAE